jgi:hypothetical protein
LPGKRPHFGQLRRPEKGPARLAMKNRTLPYGPIVSHTEDDLPQISWVSGVVRPKRAALTLTAAMIGEYVGCVNHIPACTELVSPGWDRLVHDLCSGWNKVRVTCGVHYCGG